MNLLTIYLDIDFIHMFYGFIERGGDYTLRCGWCKFSYAFSKEMATDRELALTVPLTVLNKHIGESSSGLNHCEFISGENLILLLSI